MAFHANGKHRGIAGPMLDIVIVLEWREALRKQRIGRTLVPRTGRFMLHRLAVLFSSLREVQSAQADV